MLCPVLQLGVIQPFLHGSWNILSWNGMESWNILNWNGMVSWNILSWNGHTRIIKAQLQIPSVTCHNFPDLGFSKVKFFFIEGAAFDDVAVGQEND